MFFAGLEFAEGGRHMGEVCRPSVFLADSVVRFGVAAPNEALIWLLEGNYNWPADALEAEPKPLSGVVVTLSGVEDGEWTVEW